MAYVERQRGGRHLVETDTGIDECSGWQPVCRLDEIPDGRGRPVMLKGTDVAVMRTGDTVYAVGGTCPHRGGPIADGTVVDLATLRPDVARRTDLEYML